MQSLKYTAYQKEIGSEDEPNAPGSGTLKKSIKTPSATLKKALTNLKNKNNEEEEDLKMEGSEQRDGSDEGRNDSPNHHPDPNLQIAENSSQFGDGNLDTVSQGAEMPEKKKLKESKLRRSLQAAISPQRLTKRQLNDYKDTINDFVGKYNRNTVLTLHRGRPLSVCHSAAITRHSKNRQNSVNQSSAQRHQSKSNFKTTQPPNNNHHQQQRPLPTPIPTKPRSTLFKKSIPAT